MKHGTGKSYTSVVSKPAPKPPKPSSGGGGGKGHKSTGSVVTKKK